MKILVLGSAGQVGSELEIQLKAALPSYKKDYDIVLASRSDIDVTDLQALRGFLSYHRPSWVINATAYTAVDKAETEMAQAFRVNECAVRVLAEYCATSDSNLIHVSTDYVYNGSGERAIFEDAEVGPLGVYGASKLAGEEAIKSTLRNYIILRTSWVFGVSGGNFVKTMLRLAQTQSELRIVGDQHGAPTSARGIAKTIAALVLTMSVAESDDERWGVYHYTGQPFISWAEFAREIFQQAIYRELIPSVPKVTEIGTADYPTPAVRPANSRLDCSKLKKTFDIEPDDWMLSLGSMLDELKGEIKI